MRSKLKGVEHHLDQLEEHELRRREGHEEAVQGAYAAREAMWAAAAPVEAAGGAVSDRAEPA